MGINRNKEYMPMSEINKLTKGKERMERGQKEDTCRDSSGTFLPSGSRKI